MEIVRDLIDDNISIIKQKPRAERYDEAEALCRILCDGLNDIAATGYASRDVILAILHRDLPHKH